MFFLLKRHVQWQEHLLIKKVYPAVTAWFLFTYVGVSLHAALATSQVTDREEGQLTPLVGKSAMEPEGA